MFKPLVTMLVLGLFSIFRVKVASLEVVFSNNPNMLGEGRKKLTELFG